jgi:hypothetical protein
MFGERADSITRMKITAREKRGYHTEFKQYDEKMLTDFAESIRQLTFEITKFWVSTVGRLPSQP